MTRGRLLAAALVVAAVLLVRELVRLLGLADWSVLDHPFVVDVGLRRCLEVAAVAGLLAAAGAAVRSSLRAEQPVPSLVTLVLMVVLLGWLLRPHDAGFAFVSAGEADAWKANELKLLGSGALGVFVALLAWPRAKG